MGQSKRILTSGQMQALLAVQRGDVYHVYTENKYIGAVKQSMKALLASRLVGHTDYIDDVCVVRITEKGLHYLQTKDKDYGK